MAAFVEALRIDAPGDDVAAQLELARACDAKGDGESALTCLRRAAATSGEKFLFSQWVRGRTAEVPLG